MTETTNITKPVLIFLQGLPGLLVWRANVGRRGKILFGRVGQADISGLIAPHGQRLEIETKVPKKGLSPGQQQFRREIQSMGGIYAVITSLDEAVEWSRSMRLIK